MLNDGEYLTVCAYDCPDSCGMKAVCRDGRLVSLGGRTDNPYTHGFICHKGRRWVHELRGTDRLTAPLLRQGNRFVAIPWEEALTRTADAIQTAVHHHGHQSFLFYEGSGNILLGNELQKLLPRLLGGGTMATGSLCGSEGKIGLARSYGTTGRDTPLVALESASILLWGRNPAETSVHFMAILQEARKKGARLGVIEVRPTATTAVSDSAWIIRPGSDLTLALYLCREAIAARGEPAALHEGFAAFMDICTLVTEETARQATGLSAAALQALVVFVTGRPPLSIWTGYGLQRTRWGADIVQAIDALGFLLGAHGAQGGGVWFDQEDDHLLPEDFAAVSGAQTRFVPRPGLGAALLAADPPVEAAMIVRGNPVSQCPDAGKTLQFLQHCPFSVCLDWRMTATARACTLILPVTLPLERGGDYVMSYFHDLLQKTAKVCEPPEGARDELAVVRDIARRLGLPEERFAAEERRLAAIEQDPRLEAAGPGMWRLRAQPRVQGTFHFPGFVPAAETDQDLLHLVTVHGRDAVNGTNPVQAHPPSEPPIASISPELAARLHMYEGQKVLARNELGSLPVRIHLQRGIADGTVILPEGIEGVNALVVPDLTPNGNSCINDSRVFLVPVKPS